MTQDDSRRIIVVNDDPAQLRMAGLLIEKEGYKAILCNGAEEALGILQKEGPPDLIITDLYMPGINGWRLCHLLRSPAFPDVNKYITL